MRQAWRHASCHSVGRVCRAHGIAARRRAFQVLQLTWIDIVRYNYSCSRSSWLSTPIFDLQLRWLGSNCFIYSPCPISSKIVFSTVSTRFQSTTPSIPILRTFKGSHHIPIEDQVAKPKMQPSARIFWGDLIAPTRTPSRTYSAQPPTSLVPPNHTIPHPALLTCSPRNLELPSSTHTIVSPAVAGDTPPFVLVHGPGCQK